MPDSVLTQIGLPSRLIRRSFAVIAGISEYPNLPDGEKHLPQAGTDINSIVKFLKDSEYFDEIIVLQNEDVNERNLAYLLQGYLAEQMGNQHDARFLFAFSGHGFDDGSDGFILESNATSFKDRFNSINLFNLKGYIAQVSDRALDSLVLLNSCQGGVFLNAVPYGPPQPNAQNVISGNVGAHAITAGARGQFTYAPNSPDSGSYFFQAVLDGIRRIAITNPNHSVTDFDLYSYVRQDVTNSTNNSQNPQYGDIYPHGSIGAFFFLPVSAAPIQGPSPTVNTQVPSTFGGQASWPPNATPGGSYLVTSSEQTLTTKHIFLPDNFTIRIAPDVHDLRWAAQTLEFGRGSTIDLSAPPTVPPSGVPGADSSGQPSYGVAGGNGSAGAPGTPGVSGASLILNVGSVGAKGSLWIRTDGGPGGIGGRGGNGQLGGGSSCGDLGNFNLNGEPHTNGGDGGSGGNGGAGGNGGMTSRVAVTILEPKPSLISNPVCQTSCGHSLRPAEANGDDGAIIVWGAPGCGGSGGIGGAPGGGGDSNQNRTCLIVGGVHGGVSGKPGNAGFPGNPGTCANQ